MNLRGEAERDVEKIELLERIAKSLEDIHKDLDKGNGSYLECLLQIQNALSNMQP